MRLELDNFCFIQHTHHRHPPNNTEHSLLFGAFLSLANAKMLAGLCALWDRQLNSQSGISDSKDLGSA